MSTTSPPACPQCGELLPDSGFAGLCPRCVAGSLSEAWDTLSAVPAEGLGDVPRVAGWTVLGPLGAGGQGIVWRAVRDEDDLPGAMKVFRGDSSSGAENGARMEGEAEALRRMTHECIVKVMDCGLAADGRFYIVTELVEGCDLHRLLQAERLSPERALHIAHCVARALEHAHANGIVHRDVKPPNVLTGRDGTVKLVDFSLAQAAGSRHRITVTQDGTTFGTPYYLAPEVMRGAAATAAADLYAVGVLLYETLTGAPPAGRFARVSEKCAVPRETDALVESLLSEEPEKRPASAGEVVRRLESIQALLAGSAAAWVRRGRWRIAGVVAGAAVLAGAVGYFAPRPVPPLPPVPKLNAKGFSNPPAATRTEPFTNSLGMSFIPVEGLPVLFCRHETRMSDYGAFLEGVRSSGAEWEEVYGGNTRTRRGLSVLTAEGWKMALMDSEDWKLMFGLTFHADSPASGVSYIQAQRFCSWLTWREQSEGRLGPQEYYRLPTDEEWSIAAGLPRETAATPDARHLSLPTGIPVFPWGPDWPPPANFGNYAGTEARDSAWPESWASRKVKNDDFPRTAPVGSFPESANGLRDLWGNVWEWCDSPRNFVSGAMTLRGASWVDGGFRDQFRRDFRRFEQPTRRQTDIGFRCVLVVGK